MNYSTETVVISEAFNEEENIIAFLDKFPQEYQLLLTDDGSIDSTVELARNYSFVKIIRHPVNLGQGVAFVTGLKAAIQLGYRYMIHLDSDGQHNPEDILKFDQALQKNQGDIIIGSRILGEMNKTTLLRKKFLPVLVKIINMITHYNMTDSMCGFRGYRLDKMRQHMNIFSSYHNPQYNATEMFIRASRLGFKVNEIPIEVKKRKSGASYKGELRYGWNVMMALLKTSLEGNDQ